MNAPRRREITRFGEGRGLEKRTVAVAVVSAQEERERERRQLCWQDCNGRQFRAGSSKWNGPDEDE